MTSSTPTRVAMIGCGAIGQRRHIPETVANPNAELVALVDVNLDRAKAVAAEFAPDAGAFADVGDMLKRIKPDLVIVGTPNALHASQSIQALEAGCHTLVEKPMAATLGEADAMIAASKASGKKLMVGQNQRLMPPHVKAKRILDSGVLGKPISFQTTFKHPGPEGWSVDGLSSWFFKKAPAVMGVCGDLGVHKVDLITYLLGQKIAEISGFVGTIQKTFADGSPIEVDDNAFLSVKTTGNVLGSITISWTNYGTFEDNGTSIYCENGVLLIGVDPDYPVVVRYKDGTSEHAKTGRVATNTQQTNSGVIDEFLRAVREDRPPLIPGAEGKRSLAVILAAFESQRTGKTITIDPAL
jgi:UDP-N-acetylglucosamine 3-dehydrogenase